MRYLRIESLPSSKTWVDRDELMLHSCFQILKDSVEKENVDTHCNYESCKNKVDEIRFLYNWWLKRADLEVFDIEQIEEDDEMLIRLMKIREFLWT